MAQLAHIIGDYDAFLDDIIKEIIDAGFDMDDFVQMDHMCYRVSSPESYEQKKQELTNVGRLLGENQINGRSIATFRLSEPVRHDKWRIDCVELPAPKPDVPTDKGLEHVELVLYDDQQTFLKKYAGKQFEMKAADRGVNPEIGFKLPSYGVRFHLLNLPTVVYLENKLGMDDIVTDSRTEARANGGFPRRRSGDSGVKATSQFGVPPRSRSQTMHIPSAGQRRP